MGDHQSREQTRFPTLYGPAPMLKSGKNEIVVFESDGTSANEVELFDKPDLG